jgi:ankyrin repeat protein
MRLRNGARFIVCVVASLAAACATAREPAKPVARAAEPSSVGHRPAAPREADATPSTASPAVAGSETSDRELGHPASDLETSAPDALSELGSATFRGDEREVDALLRRGADVNQRERDGATALSLALSNYHDEPKCCERAEQRRLAQMTQRAQSKLRIARTLIEHGADVTAADGLDLTPLHHAMMAYGPEEDVIAIIELLIAHGADVNRRAQPYGRSPLEWAIGQSPERVACVLRHGADPSIVTHEGQTLLQLAETRGDPSIIEQLRSALADRARK